MIEVANEVMELAIGLADTGSTLAINFAEQLIGEQIPATLQNKVSIATNLTIALILVILSRKLLGISVIIAWLIVVAELLMVIY